MSEFVSVSVDEGVGTIRLDRPKLNPLNAQVQDELAEAARAVSDSPQIKAVVLWGGPHVFAAGADIKEMADLTAAQMAPRAEELQSAFSALAEIPKPVVAAINGYALGGGCELALCADVRFAASDATLGQPEVLLGIIPGAGGTQRLARLVGPSRAKDLIFTGRFVSADEALAIGLVDRVLPPDEVYAAAVAWAGQFRYAASEALAAAKRVVNLGLDLPLNQALQLETQHFAGLFGTDDQRTGMDSFLKHGPGKARFGAEQEVSSK